MAKIIVYPLPFVLALVLNTGVAWGASRHMEATGGSLTIDSPCARSVTVEPDTTLSGRAVLDASANNGEELAQLAFDSGDAARLHILPEECWRPDGAVAWSPTLTIAIRVPAGIAVSIDESGVGDYRLGAIGGRLAVDLSGDAKVQAARATSAIFDMSGVGHVVLASANGDVKASISGNGTIDVKQATVPALDVDVSGHGGFDLGAGSVGKLKVDMSGAGSVTLGADVGNAALNISGYGTVHIAKVSGTLTKDVSGAGNIEIGQ